jgi:hypothetical protein
VTARWPSGDGKAPRPVSFTPVQEERIEYAAAHDGAASECASAGRRDAEDVRHGLQIISK